MKKKKRKKKTLNQQPWMMQKSACFCGCHGHFPTPGQLIYESSSRPHTRARGHDDGTVLAKPRLVLCNPRQELQTGT